MTSFDRPQNQLKADGIFLARRLCAKHSLEEVRDEARWIISNTPPSINSDELSHRHFVSSTAFNPSLGKLPGIRRILQETIAPVVNRIDPNFVFHDTTLQLVRSQSSSCKSAIPWHRDIGPGVSAESVISAIIYPFGLSREQGALEYCPGSHNTRDRTLYKTPREVRSIIASDSDVIFLDGRVLHRIGRNKSELMRKSIVLRFCKLNVVNNCDLFVGEYLTGCFDYRLQRSV